MRKSILRLAGIAVAVALSTGWPLAHAQRTAPSAAAENGRLWFVELAGKPVADGNTAAAVRSEQAAFRRAAAAAGLRYTERRAFDTLFNGLSVEVDARDRAKLAQIAGVKAMWPVEIIQAPAPERTGGGSAADMATAIAMTGADIAQNTLGLTGAGVKVAVMDTGIDIDHPDFGGNGTNGSTPFPTARITHGYDFVGDAFNANPADPGYNPVPVPDPNPDDCGGHGTHVAGIVGASGVVKGVAPGVTFGAYRVFGCAGSTTADIMIAAMERALADGMHVLNMSIGSAFQWPQYPTAQAASRLVDKGMVVVASIGNSGANGLYSAGAPGLGEKVIGVASFDNSHVALNTFSVDPAGLTVGYANAAAAPLAPSTGSLPLARTGTPATTNDACSALPAGSLAGTAALIRRGTCPFHTKALNAMNAGAAAVVLYNNSVGRFSPTVAGTPAITIPVVAVSDTEGVAINNAIAAGSQTLNWQSGTGSFVNPTGGLISSFSSYGLSPDLQLKPDIGAPGGLIYSTYPLESGAYATISGTSMSSPHVAGAVALLRQAQPKTPSQAVRGILQNSADPKPWWGNPGLGLLDNVHRQGAGMLDIDDAILATTRVEPAKIAAGEGEAGPFTQTLKIENKGSSAVTYNLSSVNALSTGANTFTPAFNTSNASVSFSAASVTVPPNGSATVDATITPATLPVNGQYGGYIVLTDAADASKVFRVPFAGFIGDYQSKQVLVPTANNFPRLGWSPDGVNFGFADAGDVFTLQGADIPYVLMHLDHHARRVRIEGVDAVTGKSWQRVSDDEYLPRNSTATGFFAFAWDGTTLTGKGKNASQWLAVPDGSYVLKVSVLKALGDENNPAHWETWASPAFTIDRP
ncbi:MAG: S8 family serine peptidase [Rubrivivax sp.]|nr:S8 family serine peptidase [Rubrivivax sp.]